MKYEFIFYSLYLGEQAQKNLLNLCINFIYKQANHIKYVYNFLQKNSKKLIFNDFKLILLNTLYKFKNYY